MELLQLEYFEKTAELQSISKAANHLCISQSSLSQTISHLEKELGVTLFDRVGRNIVLNDKGKVFLQSVQLTLKELSNATASVREMTGFYTGHLSVGVFASPHVMADCISRYAEQNPRVNFYVTTNLSSGQKAGLADFHLVIYHKHALFADFEGTEILRENIYLLVKDSHPLAGRPSVRLEELRDEAFVSYSLNRNSLEPNLRYCAEHYFQPKVMYYTDSPIIRQAFIERGAVGFAASTSLGDYRGGSSGIAAVRVEDAPSDTLYLGWHKRMELTPTALHFRDFALEYFKTWTPPA